MPTTMVQEAITTPVIEVRNFLMARSGKGIRKLQKTMVQNRGAKAPVCVVQKTAISEDSLPYHTVSRSAKMK